MKIITLLFNNGHKNYDYLLSDKSTITPMVGNILFKVRSCHGSWTSYDKLKVMGIKETKTIPAHITKELTIKLDNKLYCAIINDVKIKQKKRYDILGGLTISEFMSELSQKI